MVSATVVVVAMTLFLSAMASVLTPVHRALPLIDSSRNIKINDLPASNPKPHGRKTKIVDNTLVITNRQGEDVEFAVNSTESGFARVTSVGLTVQRGTSATLDFNIRARAVDAARLERVDSSFVGTLSESEREEFEQTKTTYNGGLDVSFAGFLGINLGGKTERIDMEREAESQGDYNLKSAAAREIFESTVETDIEVSGTLTATGVSFIPTTVFAFIKVAKVQLQDGRTLTVVTSDGNELVTADEGGDTDAVDSDEGDIDIVEL